MDFRPPALLRNAHVQSMLAGSKLRLVRTRLGDRTLFRSVVEEWILDCGAGVRLQAFASLQATLDRPRRRAGVVVLLHGWEGSARSAYLQCVASALFAEGWDVVRLNFRDHGDTHHLNEGLFHSNRLDEVIGAVDAIAGRWPEAPLYLIGFSLGGNFALRVALRGPARGVRPARVIAVNPVMDPGSSTDYLDRIGGLYLWYFIRKWRRSLRRKQALFPHRYDFGDVLRQRSAIRMTELLLERYTDFDSLDEYFRGYTLTGDALAGLRTPSTVITAQDDPLIYIRHFRDLPESEHLELVTPAHGGHCAYIESLTGRSWLEHAVSAILGEAAGLPALSADYAEATD